MNDYIDWWILNGTIYDIHDKGRGQPNGVATLDENGKVPDSQLKMGDAEGLATLNANGKVPESQLNMGNAEGLATLDENGKVPETQLQDYVKSVNSKTPDTQGNVALTSEDVELTDKNKNDYFGNKYGKYWSSVDLGTIPNLDLTSLMRVWLAGDKIFCANYNAGTIYVASIRSPVLAWTQLKYSDESAVALVSNSKIVLLGDKYVGTVSSGSSYKMIYSTDGVTFTESSSEDYIVIEYAISCDEYGWVLANFSNDKIVCTVDGQTFTEVPLPSSINFITRFKDSVLIGTNAGTYRVSVASCADPTAYGLANGVPNSFRSLYYAVGSFEDSPIMIAGYQSQSLPGGPNIYKSYDGITFVNCSPSSREDIYAIASIPYCTTTGKEIFIVNYDGTKLLVSYDAENWIEVTLSSYSLSSTNNIIALGKILYMYVTENNTPKILYSLNGVHWAEISYPISAPTLTSSNYNRFRRSFTYKGTAFLNFLKQMIWYRSENGVDLVDAGVALTEQPYTAPEWNVWFTEKEGILIVQQPTSTVGPALFKSGYEELKIFNVI